jgi:hypothetical protein
VKSENACTLELDLELPVSDGLGLPDQLIHPRFGYRALALVVDVDSVRDARRLSIDQHAESHRSSPSRRPHHEMKIARMKAVDDPSAGLVQRGSLDPHRPIANESPVIKPESRRGGV